MIQLNYSKGSESGYYWLDRYVSNAVIGDDLSHEKTIPNIMSII